MTTLPQETLRTQKPIHIIRLNEAYSDRIEHTLIPGGDLLGEADLLLVADLLGEIAWADGGGTRTVHFGVDDDGYSQLTIPTGSASDTWSATLTPTSAFDLYDGVSRRLTITADDASDLTDSTLTVRFTDSLGAYVEYEAVLADGSASYGFTTATGSSGTMHWEDVVTVTVSGVMAGTDGIVLTLANLTSRCRRHYSTDKIVSLGEQVLPDGMDFDAAGGTASDGVSGPVADGWTAYARQSTGGWDGSYPANALPAASSPAWAVAGTGAGAFTAVGGGEMTISGCGTATEFYTQIDFTTLLAPWEATKTGYTQSFLKASGITQDRVFGLHQYVDGDQVWVWVKDGQIIVSANTSGLGGTVFPYDTTSAFVEIEIFIDKNTHKYWVWADGVALVSAGTPKSSGSTSQFDMGKLNTTYEDGTLTVDFIGWHNNFASVAASLATDTVHGGNEQALAITYGGLSATEATFKSDAFFVSSGRSYTLRAKLRSSVAKTIPVVIREAAGGTALASTTFAVGATSTPREFVWTFTPSASASDASLEFDLGALGAFTFYITEARIHRDPPAETHVKQGYLSGIKGSGQHANPETGATTVPALSFSLLDKDDEITDLQLDWELHGTQIDLLRGYPNYSLSEFVLVNIFRGDKITLGREGGDYDFTCPVDFDRLKTPVVPGATDVAEITVGSGDGTGLDNIVDVFMRLATSTSAGGNGAWDDGGGVGPLEGEGAGIDISRFDVTEIAQERDDWLSAWTMQFIFDDGVKDLLQWAAEEIFKPCGALLYLTDEGLISVKARRTPLFAEAVAELDEDSIKEEVPGWSRQIGAGTVNRVTFYYDYVNADREYAAKVTYNDPRTIKEVDGVGKTSQDLYGVKEMVIKSKGIRSGVTAAMLEARASALFARYSTSPPKLEVTVDQRRSWISPGGIFSFSHSAVLDITSGVKGYVSRLLEVEKATPDFQTGTWKLTLVETGFRRAKTGVISGISFDYSNGGVSDDDRNKYVWIANASNLLSDGESAYVIAL
jgi:hypothetical protein